MTVNIEDAITVLKTIPTIVLKKDKIIEIIKNNISLFLMSSPKATKIPISYLKFLELASMKEKPAKKETK